ncbi:MAG: adenylyl-sulfate kinase [Flammeovirgaceae bacterium]|nr:adenylyl-sulfate kinase [Flammeovirgaceae bacterium]
MENLFKTQTKVGREQREKLLNQQSLLIWFTGLSGSGKSTLAVGLEKILFEKGFKTYLLDGDNIRQGINKDLSFDNAGRAENIRRVGEIAKLMVDSGMIVLSSFISPFQSERELVKSMVGSEKFFEVYVNCPIEICEQRDTKGLYKKARKGLIQNFTGIDSSYEEPIHPDLVLDTSAMEVNDSLNLLLEKILPRISLA